MCFTFSGVTFARIHTVPGRGKDAVIVCADACIVLDCTVRVVLDGFFVTCLNALPILGLRARNRDNANGNQVVQSHQNADRSRFGNAIQ